MGEVDTDMVTIVQQSDGRLVCRGEPPSCVLFTRDIVEILRRNGSLWAWIDGDLITLRVCPEPLYYRLTGEGTRGALVAERVTEDGSAW